MSEKNRIILIAAIVFMALVVPMHLEAQEGVQLLTRWSAEITPDNVHPAYPRPQLVRSDWTNLNGLWQYAITERHALQPEKYDGEILVPFPVESFLSGVTQRVDGKELWYQRSVSIPAAWSSQRILLHFGAVDWETTVWIDGTELGVHRGGYDSFSFDITDALRPGSEHELVLRVWDPSDSGTQPRGKQVQNPKFIWYTPTTGIWQTAWLEAVPQTYIHDLRITPDVDASTLRVRAILAGDTGNYSIRVNVLDAGTVVAQGEGHADETLALVINNPKLWFPSSPFLYDLQIDLFQGDTLIDSVSSYAGMRKIELVTDENGIVKLAVNNEPLFQYGLLDQGFWPDGLYTAPTDEALRYDIETTKQMGFNLIRKHVKVEPDRWYYWADRLGVLVWQDMPNGDALTSSGQREIQRSVESTAQFEQELRRLVESRYNHPSIVMWVLFNEGMGQFDTVRLVEWLKNFDPTRLINNASGWNDMGVGDVIDIHSYPDPAAPPTDDNRAAVLGEFGGLGLPLLEHTWQNEENFGYRPFEDSEALLEGYGVLIQQLRDLQIKNGLAAAIYTQTTDVEIEINGMMTYDRAIVKMGADNVSQVNALLFKPLPVAQVIAASSEFSGQTWRYTTEQPIENWTSPDFDDSTWQEGTGGFGTPDSPGIPVRTPWHERELWLRREFEVDDIVLSQPYGRVHHIGDTIIYLNGELLLQLPLSTDSYVEIPLFDMATQLQPGKNVLAVYVRRPTFWSPGQDPDWQFIDVGLYDFEHDEE